MTSDIDLTSTRKRLLALSLELGKPGNRLAILGEGNTSAFVDDDTFLVKASGSQLGTLNPRQLLMVRFDRILPLLDQELDQEATEAALLAARVDLDGPVPEGDPSGVRRLAPTFLSGPDGFQPVADELPADVLGGLQLMGRASRPTVEAVTGQVTGMDEQGLCRDGFPG